MLAEATVEGEDHADGVVGDFVHAVVGDVGDDDAELGGGRDVDVVDADAVSGSDHAFFGGSEDVAGDLSEAEHYHISIGGQPGEGLIRRCRERRRVRRRLGSQDFAFNVDVGPDVVGDQSLFWCRHGGLSGGLKVFRIRLG